MKNRYLVRAVWLLMPIAAIGIGALLWRSARADSVCTGNLPKQPIYPSGDKVCPVVGKMGGVKLAIPEHYILGPVTYKGVDIWNAESFKNRPKHPDFDTEIDNFAIRIRLSNFKPIESKQDWKDYGKLGEMTASNPPPLENRWIHVSFSSPTAYDDETCRGSQRCYFENLMKDDMHWGPFLPQKTDVYGLKHYVSAQRPAIGKSIGKFDEFFYDAATQKTMITCSNDLMEVPPYIHLSSCQHGFVVPELQGFADVDYNHPANESLARWREVEDEIRKPVQSFIVP